MPYRHKNSIPQTPDLTDLTTVDLTDLTPNNRPFRTTSPAPSYHSRSQSTRSAHHPSCIPSPLCTPSRSGTYTHSRNRSGGSGEFELPSYSDSKSGNGDNEYPPEKVKLPDYMQPASRNNSIRSTSVRSATGPPPKIQRTVTGLTTASTKAPAPFSPIPIDPRDPSHPHYAAPVPAPPPFLPTSPPARNPTRNRLTLKGLKPHLPTLLTTTLLIALLYTLLYFTLPPRHSIAVPNITVIVNAPPGGETPQVVVSTVSVTPKASSTTSPTPTPTPTGKGEGDDNTGRPVGIPIASGAGFVRGTTTKGVERRSTMVTATVSGT